MDRFFASDEPFSKERSVASGEKFVLLKGTASAVPQRPLEGAGALAPEVR
jgi:hypothetical protein